MLKQKEVEINGTKYIVKELTMGQMLPLMERFDGPEAKQAQMDMMALSVCDADGNTMLDQVKSLGVSTYMALTPMVLEVNGMGESGNE